MSHKRTGCRTTRVSKSAGRVSASACFFSRLRRAQAFDLDQMSSSRAWLSSSLRRATDANPCGASTTSMSRRAVPLWAFAMQSLRFGTVLKARWEAPAGFHPEAGSHRTVLKAASMQTALGDRASRRSRFPCGWCAPNAPPARDGAHECGPSRAGSPG
jgi:hypothetical protein